MTAFLYNAPAGIKGDVSRIGESNVESVIQGSQFSAYGLPAVFNGSGQAIPFGAGNVAIDFQGILVRQAPAISGNALSGFDDTIPWLEALQGLMPRGYAMVKCAAGTPVRGGLVYIQITASGGVAVGEFRASSDGGNAVALLATQAEWATNGKDGDNLAEIRVRA